MADALWMKLRKVRWDDFPGSPNSKKQVPRIIEALSSRKEPRAMKAAHDLWVALCSNQIWPVAEPSYPFLIEVLEISQPSIQGEILDILTQFANSPSQQDFEIQLITFLKRDASIIAKLTRSNDALVAEKAKCLHNTIISDL